MKNCDYYMDKYLELDKNQRVPFKVAAHILFCKDCRKQVRFLTKAEKLSASSFNDCQEINSVEVKKIMEKINPEFNSRREAAPLIPWIFAGIIVIICLVLALSLISSSVNQFLKFQISLFTGLCISGYFFMFVAFNIDFFVKRINLKKEL